MNLSINLKNLELNLGNKKITIKDKFTLIVGKFEQKLSKDYQNQEFLQIIEEIDLIPAKKLINYFQSQSNELNRLENALKILDCLTNYRKIVEYNSDIFKKFNKIIRIILLTFKYVYLSERKNQLEKELELAKKHKKSSELSAIVDLINKLKESINANKKKLNYIKEDYFQCKNQIEQIKEKLAISEESIRELNQSKKDCFNQINRITRQIDGSSNNQKNDSKLNLDIDSNQSNAEKIRTLQKKAKDTQYEINQIKIRTKEIKEELEKLMPHYDIYKNDYEEILDSIKEDENRIRMLQIEYEKEVNANKEIQIEAFKDLLKTPIRPSLEVEDEISRINFELDSISIPDDFFTAANPSNLKVIIEKLRELNDILRHDDEKTSIHRNEEEISNIFEKYNIFESIIKDLEGLLNIFIKEINLEVKLLLFINDTNTLFFLKTDFIRNNKEKANFKDLTTPEKIFFIISFFISIEVLLDHDNILFSNLFIPNIYNKSGSIYRTIRKLLPLFETNENLKKYNLIFLISNLELKKEINNIKLIRI
ncbi:MAG: coiled-coil domain-containing protein [Candidatus Hermodarchaeota archaeon]